MDNISNTKPIPELQPKDIERFWSKVSFSGKGGCWNWIGLTSKTGYGRIQIKGFSFLSHRIAWFLANGPIPKSLLICHHCDNTSCVNPKHFFVGTVKDNMRDAAKKGLLATGKRCGVYTHPEKRSYGKRNGAYTHPECVLRGEQIGTAKLDAADVCKIRQLYPTGKYTFKSLAHKFGVSKSLIGVILSRKAWRHIS